AVRTGQLLLSRRASIAVAGVVMWKFSKISQSEVNFSECGRISYSLVNGGVEAPARQATGGASFMTAMGEIDRTDCERLLSLARSGDGVSLGRLLELFRNYLSLMARVQVGRRLQG